MCLKIYYLDLVKVISAPGLAWKAALNKTEVKSELLTDIDMLLMVEKGVRVGICHANNKFMKDSGKTKDLSYLKYWDLNKLFGGTTWQKHPVDHFEDAF